MNRDSGYDSILRPLRSDLTGVERVIRTTVDEAREPLRSMFSKVFEGGKRLRPALVILVGRLLGGEGTPFHRLGAGTEMLHVATLIHDDLMDGAYTRRGRATLHTSWPPRATILAGDYLMSRSAAIVAEFGVPDIVRVFARALCTLCEGEIHQVFATGENPIRMEDYLRSIEAKTASLCAAAAQMSGMLAGASDRQVEDLRRFGRAFGLAFQIVDDVLDFIGDEAELGKPAGNDLRQGLVTLPTLLYLENEGDPRPLDVVLSGNANEAQVRRAIEAVRSSGAIEAAMDDARKYAGMSVRALSEFQCGETKKMIESLVTCVVERRC
jgi:heptaprenyl diphosphate synthase/octaprenyl-diphosphate synthase